MLHDRTSYGAKAWVDEKSDTVMVEGRIALGPRPQGNGVQARVRLFSSSASNTRCQEAGCRRGGRVTGSGALDNHSAGE